jgi:hypothetical protein
VVKLSTDQGTQRTAHLSPIHGLVKYRGEYRGAWTAIRTHQENWKRLWNPRNHGVNSTQK